MMQIEPASRVADGMNQHCADTDHVGGLSDPAQSIAKQGLAKSAALFASVHGETRQQNQSHRVVRNAMGDSLRRFVPENRTSGQRVLRQLLDNQLWLGRGTDQRLSAMGRSADNLRICGITRGGRSNTDRSPAPACYTRLMGSPARAAMTPKEYLARERKAEFKSEYWNGQVFAMSGGTEKHVTITTNLTVALYLQLSRKGCRIFGSDMRVRVEASDLYTYPDVSVVCGKRKFEGSSADTLLNPVLIAEVLSPSTERYDRVGKFAMYSAIESLREYVLVSQSSVHVERYLRHPGGKWAMTEAVRLKDAIKLASVPAVLKLRDVYRQVDF